MRLIIHKTMAVMIMICVIMSWSSPLFANEVIVIANASVPADTLDENNIKNIFLGKSSKWENNDRITVVILEYSATHKAFLEKYIKRTPSQFANVWRQNMFTGKGKQPYKAESIEEVVNYVSNTQGAIGYASSETTLPTSVKVVGN